MQGILNKLFRQGVSDTLPDNNDSFRIVRTNRTAILMFIASFPYPFIFAYIGEVMVGLFAFLTIALYLGVLVLNHFHLHHQAKWLLLLVANLGMFVFVIALGYDHILYVGYFPISCLPILVLKPTNRRAIFSFFTLSVLLAMLAQMKVFPSKEILHLDAWLLEIVNSLTVFSCIIILLGLISYFTYSNFSQFLQLTEAREKADAANIAKTEFLSTMSHEIRTPLNAVIGLTGLLSETQLDEDQEDYVRTVRLSGENLLSVINDILDFSKIESGKMELEMQPFALTDPIEDVFDLMSSSAHSKNIELLYYIDKSVPSGIISDVTRLRQVLVNLINNAIKFTESGEIFISLAKVGSTPEGARIQFSVRDTGIGIPAERMDRLFQSFSQVDASTTRKYGGTGLGLAISKRLIELLGGEIWVESEVGKGTTFFFTIEAKAADLPVEELEFKSLNFKGKKVFVVDDNETNLKILRLQCEGWGLEVETCNHPVNALRILRERNDFNFAILDMHMPEMDGITLAKRVREFRTERELPFVMLSSVADNMEESEKKIFNTYLTKPVRPHRLGQAIRLVINEQFRNEKVISFPAKKKPDLYENHNRNLRILVVEDNMVNQKVAGKILNKFGYKADFANNGLEGVKAISMIKYDLVFMDVQMPEMDGLTATREVIKLFPDPSDRPVIIAMTANALKEDQERCVEAGMDDFISKPVKVEIVDQKIRDWFYKEEAVIN